MPAGCADRGRPQDDPERFAEAVGAVAGQRQRLDPHGPAQFGRKVLRLNFRRRVLAIAGK